MDSCSKNSTVYAKELKNSCRMKRVIMCVGILEKKLDGVTIKDLVKFIKSEISKRSNRQPHSKLKILITKALKKAISEKKIELRRGKYYLPRSFKKKSSR